MAKYEKVTIELDGLKELEKDLERMGKELASNKAQRAMKASMMPVKQAITEACPVEYGSLKQTIRFEEKQGKWGLGQSITIGKTGKAGKYKRTTSQYKKGQGKPVYAIQVEFGTSKTKEHKFIRPQWDGKEEQLAKRLVRLLNNQILKWKNTGK